MYIPLNPNYKYTAAQRQDVILDKAILQIAHNTTKTAFLFNYSKQTPSRTSAVIFISSVATVGPSITHPVQRYTHAWFAL